MDSTSWEIIRVEWVIFACGLVGIVGMIILMIHEYRANSRRRAEDWNNNYEDEINHYGGEEDDGSGDDEFDDAEDDDFSQFSSWLVNAILIVGFISVAAIQVCSFYSLSSSLTALKEGIDLNNQLLRELIITSSLSSNGNASQTSSIVDLLANKTATKITALLTSGVQELMKNMSSNINNTVADDGGNLQHKSRKLNKDKSCSKYNFLSIIESEFHMFCSIGERNLEKEVIVNHGHDGEEFVETAESTGGHIFENYESNLLVIFSSDLYKSFSNVLRFLVVSVVPYFFGIWGFLFLFKVLVRCVRWLYF